jgi:hypothetical protein
MPPRVDLLVFGIPLVLLGWVVWQMQTAEPRSLVTSPSALSSADAAPAENVPLEGPEELGVRALLGELADPMAVARLPDPPYVAHLASSYDRRSVSADDPKGWFANEDWASHARPNYVRIEESSGRLEYVLLDVTGPGALVRLWSASPAGTLRIYLDGQEQPVLAERMAALLSGQGSIPPPFAYVAALGHNLYFPFPFRRACKVTVDDLVVIDPMHGGPLERFYYQINYRTYPPSVSQLIRTFRRADLVQNRSTMARVAARLTGPQARDLASPDLIKTSLANQGEDTQGELEQPRGGVIRQLVLHPADTSEAALRRAELTISFDDELTVRAPLGDFFGTGPGLSVYQSLPFEVRADGTLICRWPMPFQKRVRLRVHGSPGLTGEFWAEPLVWEDRSLHFYARWRPPSSVPTRPMRDLGLLQIKGNGIYVGSSFNLANPPGAPWWGEGDEKIYVDQERFPSLFGTGTEDYYGYAWSTTERFARPFHAQTRTGAPGFDGQFSMNRFHLLDAVPFTRAFRFDMELWHWSETRVTWDAMIYYYARPGATDDAPVAMVGSRD